MNIKHEFFDLLPVKRKSAADWMLPALAGLGVGVCVGVCVGALYAPTTGEEARLRLRERVREGKNRLKEKAQTLAERTKSRVENASEEVQGRLGGA